MKTRKRTRGHRLSALAVSALLLLVVAVGLSAGAAAAPAAPPSAQISGAPIAVPPDAICTPDVGTNTRTCDLWALPGSIGLPGTTGLPATGPQR